MAYERIVVNNKTVFISDSQTQLNNCFDHFALDEDNIVVVEASTREEFEEFRDLGYSE